VKARYLHHLSLVIALILIEALGLGKNLEGYQPAGFMYARQMWYL